MENGDPMKLQKFGMLIPCVFAAALCACTAQAAEPLDKTKEEAALQKNAEAFVEAFNKGDAKAAAAFFTEDGDIIDQDGRQIKGRKAIEKTYTKVFAGAKGAKLFIKITSLRVASPNLALEDGLTEVVPGDGGPPSAARYSVVHVKQDGEWRMESVREAIAVPPNNTGHLEGLDFLIGEWTEDVDKGGSAKASYSWDANQNFILNTFDVTMKDVSVASGTQYIGWDAAAKKPRAWSFLFNGGFAEGVWTSEGENKWKIAVVATMRDGAKVTATNVFTKIDADHFSFQFTDRTRDGKALPDDKAIKMKRVQ
jgi:uncharacterized protein (TIGR02246 family)